MVRERQEARGRHEAHVPSRMPPFLAGVLVGAAGLVLARALAPRRRGLDPRLIRRGHHKDVAPVVIIPGIMGSGLLKPDGTPVWLNVRNALGHYNLSLPFTLPFSESRDDLVPGGLLGTDAVLPRLFGFTEYSDLVELLQAAGFRPASPTAASPTYHVFSYDWRRDLVESARRLHQTLQALAESHGDPDTRFNVIGHSMGGLMARYYLRYGTAEPEEGARVTWAGARRIRNLILVAVPSGGGIRSLEAILYGNRVGLSYATLAAPVVARMPSVYQLLPPLGAAALIDHKREPLPADLHEVATWERFGWGPFAPAPARRLSGIREEDQEAYRTFLEAVLARAKAIHAALARPPSTPCPVRTVVLGGDCLPTLARCLVPEKTGLFPRFEPMNRAEADAMFEAGDGRVTRASVLASHLLEVEDLETCGLPEVSRAFIGSADHHGIYREPTFQSILLRLLMQPGPARPPAAPATLARAEQTPAVAAAPTAPTVAGPLAPG